MPIQQVESRVRLPILGKIRLGVRKTAKSGAQYPDEVEYFVLKDAPEVAAVYGDDPRELDIVFPTDDLEEVLPTWFKLYGGGMRGPDGEHKGGKLNCYGNGPNAAGEPGEAFHLMKRDALTGVVPVRPCLGPQCPDWKNSRGEQQCKQTMSVICILPRVTWMGAFKIDTTSWNSITSFHNQIRLVMAINGGSFRNTPFKIVREKKSTRFFDVKAGKEVSRDHHIMTLKPNERFEELYGIEAARKLSALRGANLFVLPESKSVIEAPMEDHFAVSDSANVLDVSPSVLAEDQPKPVEQKLQDANALLQDLEIMGLFDALQKVTGKVYSDKARLLAIRQREGAADLKAAVKSSLEEKISIETDKFMASQPQAIQAAPVQPEVKQQVATQPISVAANSDGII